MLWKFWNLLENLGTYTVWEDNEVFWLIRVKNFLDFFYAQKCELKTVKIIFLWDVPKNIGIWTLLRVVQEKSFKIEFFS